MADYYPLLSRAVSGLPSSTPETRRAIYDRAGQALLGQLKAIDPPIPEADIERESKALDEAIARIEREHAAESGATAIEKALQSLMEANAQMEAQAAAPSPAPVAMAAPAVEAAAVESAAAKSPAAKSPVAKSAAAPPPPLAPMPPKPPSAPGARPQMPLAASATTAVPEAAAVQASAPAAPAQPQDLDRVVRPSGPTVSPVMTDKPTRPGASDSTSAARAQGGKKTPVLLFGGLALIIAAVAGGIGFYAWKNRISPDQLRARTTTAVPTPAPVSVAPSSPSSTSIVPAAPEPATAAPAAPPQQAAAPPKVESRASNRVSAETSPGQAAPEPPSSAPSSTPSPAPTSAQPARPEQPAQAGLPVAQRAAILIAQPTQENRDNVATFVGTVVWRTDTVTRGAGQPAGFAVKAEIDIPDAKFSAVMTIEKNVDPTLPASHTVTWRFQRADDSPIPEVVETDTLQMRDESQPNVDPLLAARARITTNIFIIALASSDQMMKRNVELLEKKGWFDLPVRTADNRLAKITLEKGTPGERIMLEALAKWAN